MLWGTLLWVYAISGLHRSCSHTMEDSRNLLNDKLVNYTKVFRPKNNQSEQLEVLIHYFYLLSIKEFDEVKGKLSIVGVLAMGWTDEYMRWDPQSYGGIQEVRLDGDMVWTPSIVVSDTVEDIEKIGYNSPWQPIFFTDTGDATYVPGGIFTSACDVDITYYPWDEHKCRMQFTAWAYNREEIKLVPVFNSMDVSYFTPNGVWEYKGGEVRSTFGNISFDIIVFLERKPMFTFANIILPVIFMTILNAVIFLIPIESGERLSYNITVLLAIAVFHTLIGDNLPKISNPMSVFSYYLATTLATSVCMTIASIYSMRIYYRDDEQAMGRLWLWLARCFSKKYTRNLRMQTVTPANDILCEKSDHVSTFEKQGDDLNDQHKCQSRAIEPTGKPIAENEVKWKDVSMVVDKICFILYVLVILVSTTTYFAIVLAER